MNQNEHLDAIVTRCRELLAISEGRTPGKWTIVTPEQDKDLLTTVIRAGRQMISAMDMSNSSNALFIASAAGPFEASLRSTIAAIEGLQEAWGQTDYGTSAETSVSNTLEEIRAAWPIELLK